jgi:hypothetical protein
MADSRRGFHSVGTHPRGKNLRHGVGGHEAAAIGWLPENRPGLFEKLEDQRIAEGYQIYLDSDGTDMIKQFMFANGYVRLGPPDDPIEIEGRPNSIQRRLADSLAERLGVTVTDLTR